MRIPTNHVKSITAFFREELAGLYSTEEIENFCFYSFEHFLGFTRSDLTLKAMETVNESELLKFNDLVKRLKCEEPIQYILGEAWFYGLKFKVNKNVLIPRPETEELVEWIVKDVRTQESGVRSQKSKDKKSFWILDIGTGSGCIAIALKKELPRVDVFAMDVSATALVVAKENAALNNVAVNFVEADILQLSHPATVKLPPPITIGTQIPLFPQIPEFKFDIIVSNPPYVLSSEKQTMSKNVLGYEPHLALFVEDTDPLLFYKSIIDFAEIKLEKNGKLFFEINETMAHEVKELLLKHNFKGVEIRKDLNGKERMIKAERKEINS